MDLVAAINAQHALKGTPSDGGVADAPPSAGRDGMRYNSTAFPKAAGDAGQPGGAPPPKAGPYRRPAKPAPAPAGERAWSGEGPRSPERRRLPPLAIHAEASRVNRALRRQELEIDGALAVDRQEGAMMGPAAAEQSAVRRPDRFGRQRGSDLTVPRPADRRGPGVRAGAGGGRRRPRRRRAHQEPAGARPGAGC